MIIIDREYARVQSYGRGNGSGDSPLDVRLSPWTEAGVASDPATHFRVPRNHLIRFVDGFGVAWRVAPPLRERLIDAFLEVARSSALGNPRHGAEHYVLKMWGAMMGHEPLPERLEEMAREGRGQAGV